MVVWICFWLLWVIKFGISVPGRCLICQQGSFNIWFLSGLGLLLTPLTGSMGEQLVRTVKIAPRKAVGISSLTHTELLSVGGYWSLHQLQTPYLRCRWCGGQRAFEPCTCAVVASTVEPGGDPSWLWELEPETAALAKSFPSVLMVVDWVHS